MIFCTRFIPFGRALLNSSYSALAGASFLHCRQDQAMISHEMAEDVRELQARMGSEQCTPIVESPDFMFPGIQGVSKMSLLQLRSE